MAGVCRGAAELDPEDGIAGITAPFLSGVTDLELTSAGGQVVIYAATRGGAWVAAWSLNSPCTPALLQRFDMSNGPGIAGASAVVSADLDGEV
ncbi:hypothetical protein [Salipiger marinus]|uniref:Uncharacterized protein n=1 Tax=Salipiger marinus TaxID=555512 RepID=A0A1G8QJ38_9RHOB|nr:hypothetical protein [Salipiger marinus]SDJ04809.1 hypothetical protein SAMN04487993_101620 [Salipiger marinus]